MSLAEKLNEIREGAKQRIPEELRLIMARSTTELRESDILDSVLKKGDSLPPFALPNQNGDLVSSTVLLQRGPLVITFYRGVW
ncbi:MAG: hypothetical protein IH612_01875 [Desulfofustis sp.]|nr:hypothetical protein [Desulfofustis sp.]